MMPSGSDQALLRVARGVEAALGRAI